MLGKSPVHFFESVKWPSVKLFLSHSVIFQRLVFPSTFPLWGKAGIAEKSWWREIYVALWSGGHLVTLQERNEYQWTKDGSTERQRIIVQFSSVFFGMKSLKNLQRIFCTDLIRVRHETSVACFTSCYQDPFLLVSNMPHVIAYCCTAMISHIVALQNVLSLVWNTR